MDQYGIGIPGVNIFDLNTNLAQYSNGQKEVGLQMVQDLNAIWNLECRTIWILDK